MALCKDRLDAEEWIDGADAVADGMSETLRDQAWVNHWLGGARAALAHAFPVLAQSMSIPVRVLDLACGGADIPRQLVEKARRTGRAIEVVGLDRRAQVANHARQASADYPEITIVQGDALCPPFRKGTFDLVMLTTFLHHLQPDEVVAALRAACSLSRDAVIAVDLVRSPVALTAFSLLAPLVGFHHVSRHDGAASLLRSYTADELAALARRAGWESFTLRRHKFYRVALVHRLGIGGGG